MTVELNKVKTIINHSRERRKNLRTKNRGKQFKTVLIRKTYFDLEEILDKLLLFDLKNNKQR